MVVEKPLWTFLEKRARRLSCVRRPDLIDLWEGHSPNFPISPMDYAVCTLTTTENIFYQSTPPSGFLGSDSECLPMCYCNLSHCYLLWLLMSPGHSPYVCYLTVHVFRQSIKGSILKAIFSPMCCSCCNAQNSLQSCRAHDREMQSCYAYALGRFWVSQTLPWIIAYRCLCGYVQGIVGNILE